MLLWKSRWSWVRFVKTAAAKRSPATRWSTSEWLETSMTTWVQPLSAISRSSS